MVLLIPFLAMPPIRPTMGWNAVRCGKAHGDKPISFAAGRRTEKLFEREIHWYKSPIVDQQEHEFLCLALIPGNIVGALNQNILIP
jgi:hypothetical protein